MRIFHLLRAKKAALNEENAGCRKVKKRASFKRLLRKFLGIATVVPKTV
jgi:hypothetical protein